jgi:hypothetical protein
MADVLTTSSTVGCGHGSSEVATSSTAKLKVEGSPVLLKSSIENQSVKPGTCATPISQTSKKCTTVKSVTAGEATKLKAGGAAAMLATLKGSTDGMVGGTTPQLLLKATANQSKLTAS